MRDRYRRRLRASLWGAVAVGIAVSLSPKVGAPLVPAAQPAAPAEAGRAALAAPDQAAASAALIQAVASRPGGPVNSRKVTAADIAAVLGPGGKNLTGRHGNAVTQARTVIQYLGQTEASAAQEAGVFLPSGTYSAGGQAGPAGPAGTATQRARRAAPRCR